MPLIDNTGKSKLYAFIVTPENVHQELLKMNGIDFDRKILFLEKRIQNL